MAVVETQRRFTTNPATIFTEPQYSERQLAYQRQLLHEKRAERLPGDGVKGAMLATEVGVTATATDLVKSHLADLIRHPLENKAKDAVHQFKSAASNNATDTAELKKKAKWKLGYAMGADLAEEWATDTGYTAAANAWLRTMTGMSDATYVTETAAFLSEACNTVFQVFLNDMLVGKTSNGEPVKLGPVKLAFKSYDFVNPVNAESVLRVFEEFPVLGDGVVWLHEKSDKLLSSVFGKTSNILFGKAIHGFHLGKDIAWKTV